MNAVWTHWLAQILATDTPALPHAWVMHIWLHLGWSVVLACLGASIVGRWMPASAGKLDGRQWGVALALALWTLVPGPVSPAYWLGLAFQAPSIPTVLVCDALLRARFFATRSGIPSKAIPHRATLAIALAGVLAGWALLLDTFAVLPMQLYAWGFSSAAVGTLLIVALVPWLVVSATHPTRSLRLWIVPVAVVVFAASRLPSGNVWDAVLDPWLWLALHVYVVRAVWRGLRR
ncbi:MAG: hypothetical protein ABIZ09_14680 [Rhodoferax sp.]